jgi:RES domain-containing protein
VLKGRALEAAIRRLPSRPLRDIFFRATPLEFASDPLGRRRPINAQRFNLKNGARILYLAGDQITSLDEAQLFGFPPVSAALIAIQVNLRAVVDLRNPVVQRILYTDDAELSFNFRSLGLKASATPTQMFGERVAVINRIDGLIYESPAHVGHKNIAIIESAPSVLGSSLLVNDPGGVSDQLP